MEILIQSPDFIIFQWQPSVQLPITVIICQLSWLVVSSQPLNSYSNSTLHLIFKLKNQSSIDSPSPETITTMLHAFIYKYIYTRIIKEVSRLFFVWALLLIVYSWKFSPFQSNFNRLQCTCSVPTTSGRPHGSLHVWACQWPSSQPLSSPQLSHNHSLWA